MLPDKISLIGMPSSGKSTIAKALSERMEYLYVDLDHMVEEKEGMSLIEVMEKKGPEYFRDVEYGFLQAISSTEKVIISTPGSSIYHEPMMLWLKANTFIVCIEEEISAIEERLAHTPKAVSDLKEKGLKRLWQERMPVYKKWADVCIKINGRSVLDIVDECILKLNK